MTEKPTNPKTSVGIRKWRYFTTVPLTVIAEVGVAMLEGARKYGRHNYRESGVLASVYTDAAMGHIMQWWEGEDLDPDTNLSHITKAITSLVVLRDAMIQDQLSDDRPPKAKLDRVRAEMQQVVDAMFDKYPEPKSAHVAREKNTLLDWRGNDCIAPTGDIYTVRQHPKGHWTVRRNGVDVSYDWTSEYGAKAGAQHDYDLRTTPSQDDPAPVTIGHVVHGIYTPGRTVAGIAAPDEKSHVVASVFHPTQADL